MTSEIMNKIMKTMNSVFPNLEMAIFDSQKRSKNRLQVSDTKLSRQPVFTLNSDGSFQAAIPVENEGIFALGGKEVHPGDAKLYYAMAQKLISLICQQETMLQQILLQGDEISMLLSHLVSTNSEDVSYASMSALHHGYNMTLKRNVCLLNFDFPEDLAHSQSEIIASALIILKRMKGMTDQELIGQLTEHQIIVCKTLTEDTAVSNTILRQRYQPFLEIMHRTLEQQLGIPLQIAVGDVVTDVHQYGNALSTARHVLELAKKFEAKEKILFLEDYLLEYEMTLMPHTVLDHFFGNFASNARNSPWMFETIKALVQNNMEQKATAASLYIHKNTLAFRLKQIREKLQLNPYDLDSDRFTLTALYYYMVLYPPIKSKK